MSSTTFGHSPAELEKKLSVYWDLVEERETIETRIAAARREKDSVNERIFRKVIADYEAALEATAENLSPLKDEIDELRRSVDQEIGQLDASIQDLEDEIGELHFRRRVGEFEDEQLARRLAPLEPKVVEARDRRGELSAQLEAMDRRRSENQPSGEVSPHAGVAAGSEAVSPDVTIAPDVAPTNEPVSPLENPHLWADEIEPVELDESSYIPRDTSAPETTSPADETTDVDPLEALSDPAPTRETSGAGAEAQPAAAGQAAAVAPSYPSLVIRSGVHAGKIVPLLPMTMSIGREHDNNIELKDPEVARYHARILYADARFVIEDLESSTGTWVNGERLTRAALNDGDVIRIGGTELVLEFA
jgi:hypothetical protein